MPCHGRHVQFLPKQDGRLPSGFPEGFTVGQSCEGAEIRAEGAEGRWGRVQPFLFFSKFLRPLVAEYVLRFKAYIRKNQGKPFNHESYFSDKMVLKFMTTRIPSV